MSPPHYEEIDHTADLALKVWGEDFKALLRHAALGLYDLMGVKELAGSYYQRQFTIEGGSLETILVDFLNELLYLAEEKKAIFTSFKFDDIVDCMEVHCEGQKILSICRNIKAVTFHNLTIEKTDRGLETIITFDV